MTSRAQKEDCDWQRDRQDEKCAALGHDMEWTLGPNSQRRGHAYHWLGRCRHDAAEITVGDTWTSCSGIRDARTVRCSGPGTAILTEIEDDHASELVANAVADYGRALAQALAEPSGALGVTFGPEPPQRTDLLIVTNQRGDHPGAVRGITVHGVDPDEARHEIESARTAGRAVVINLPGGPYRIPTGLITGYEFITCSCGRPS